MTMSAASLLSDIAHWCAASDIQHLQVVKSPQEAQVREFFFPVPLPPPCQSLPTSVHPVEMVHSSSSHGLWVPVVAIHLAPGR